MLLEVLETLESFVDCWNVSGGDPPEDEDRPLDGLEPLLSVTKWSKMRTLVDELLERFEGLPN